MAKLLTPRGYLSPTQVDMWLNNRDRYIANYMLGEDRRLSNSGLTFGSKASQALQDGDGGGDAAMAALVALMPRYGASEHEIRATMRTRGDEVDLLGRLDTFDPATCNFDEYKTGRWKWTQEKAQKSNQMRHYATLIYLKHGKLPEKCRLHWACTEEVDGEVRLTGDIRTFRVVITLGTVLEYMALAGRVAREIDAEYRAQMKRLT